MKIPGGFSNKLLLRPSARRGFFPKSVLYIFPFQLFNSCVQRRISSSRGATPSPVFRFVLNTVMPGL
jgi:hypothetical protein